MVLIGVIVTAVVAVRLGHMEKQVERAQAQLPRNVKEALDINKSLLVNQIATALWAGLFLPYPVHK
ncbi:hypothetical protein ANCCAN_09328, partial [Ancylostoma caninum]